MTVTDYTGNKNLKMSMPDREPHSLLWKFHEQHGVGNRNWSVTAERLMAVYLKSPILKVIYQQLNPTSSCERLSPINYRQNLLGKVVRLSQLDIRFRPNVDFKIYATMAHLSQSQTDSITSLAKRIIPIKSSEPAFKKLLDNKELYKCELNQPVGHLPH
jgi:hypothetical protein